MIDMAALPKLERDVRQAAATLGVGEARTLVDLYYQLQDFRIQASNQTRALTKTDDPHDTIAFFNEQFHSLELNIAKALDTYSASQVMGEWAREHVGVGPVIAAGLLAHIDVTKSPTPSSLWTFAGLAPGQKYEKGKVRNWNADLKVLCWKLGDSFVKQSGRDNCYYGHLYRQRKEKEIARNEAVRLVHNISALNPTVPWTVINGIHYIGGNAEAALKSLTERNIKDKDLLATLRSGKLPDGQLDMRARRWAVKRFLLHYWQAAWWATYGTQPPRAYVFEHLNHVDEDTCPVPFPQPRSAV